MDIETLASGLLGLTLVSVIILALTSRKKGGSNSRDDLFK